MEMTVKNLTDLCIAKVKIINNKTDLLLFEGNVNELSGNILDREVVSFDSEMNCIIRIYVE
jgi:hypothetical protein